MKHAQWMALSDVEYARILDLLKSLDPGEWEKPTDCAEWDVRQVVAHLVGSARMNASLREAGRQDRLGRTMRGDRPLAIDGVTAVQVSERADHSPGRLLGDLADAAPRAMAGRRRVRGPLRWLRLPMDPPLRWRPLSYLVDVVLTRDLWMHRIDLARASGCEPVLTADHDGRIVADIVAEWARRHGEAYELILTGPAGGTFRRGAGGEVHRLDAVEFARILSGRAVGEGLLQQKGVVF